MRRLDFYKECTSDLGDHYEIMNKKRQIIGRIYIDENWKKWVFEAEEEMIFTWDCLQEIIDFMKERNCYENTKRMS